MVDAGQRVFLGCRILPVMAIVDHSPYRDRPSARPRPLRSGVVFVAVCNYKSATRDCAGTKARSSGTGHGRARQAPVGFFPRETYMIRLALALAIAISTLTAANATQVTASFTQVSGASWTVDFAATNDGTPEVLSGFTVYFSESLFADLTLEASPATWDSIVIEPDLALPSAGFLDTFAIDPGDALTLGQTQDGFRVGFTFSGSGAPPMLPFDIVDRDFNVLFSGTTTAPIPEPATALLLLLGLAAAVGRTYAIRERVNTP